MLWTTAVTIGGVLERANGSADAYPTFLCIVKAVQDRQAEVREPKHSIAETALEFQGVKFFDKQEPSLIKHHHLRPNLNILSLTSLRHKKSYRDA